MLHFHSRYLLCATVYKERQQHAQILMSFHRILYFLWVQEISVLCPIQIGSCTKNHCKLSMLLTTSERQLDLKKFFTEPWWSISGYFFNSFRARNNVHVFFLGLTITSLSLLIIPVACITNTFIWAYQIFTASFSTDVCWCRALIYVCKTSN